MTFPLRTATWQDLLAEQDGVLSRRQALAVGMPIGQWRWLLERARWQQVLPGVAVAHTGEVTWLQQAWASVLYAGDGAALSGDAAIQLIAQAGQRRALEPPARLDVAIPEGCQRAATGAFVPHRCSRLGDIRHPVRSPPQVRIAPAVLHAAAWAPTDRAAEWRIAAPVQQRLVRVVDVRRELARHLRLHRRSLVSRVLLDVELGAHAQTELDFLALLRRNSLPLPDRLQLLVRGDGLHYLDCSWRRQRIGAEIDGAHHRDVENWDRDTLRANDIQLRMDGGMLLLRFTGGNLRHDELAVVAQLRRALR